MAAPHFSGLIRVRLATAVIAVALAAAGATATTRAAVAPVRLEAYPQKFRTFFKPDDPAVPAALRENENAASPAASSPASPVAPPAPVRASDGALWSPQAIGLLRLDERAPERDRRQYFAGQRYLPDDAVRRILPDANGGMWVRTATGVAHLELRPMTLAQKAALMERNVRARHDRYGMLGDSHLATPGDLATNQHVDNDNNGLWTAIYAAAECFRYGATKSPEALANARRAVEALLFLEEITGRRGFPARSYIRKGDRMPTDGEWHWTDDGAIYWKGDTSSDEIVGHFFAFSVAYDLLPDADLRQRIAATTRRIMDHIIANGYHLVGPGGKPTRWGKWSREYFAEDPEDSALNSLELLSFLKVAAHVTGDARYETEYRTAAHDLGYAALLLKLREVRKELNYSDEELAMLPFYTVFRYERDPAMLATYRRALDDWWENIRRELNPPWTFIYLTGRPDAAVDLPGAAWTLYRMPIDLVNWDVRNSHRTDVAWAGAPDRFGRREARTLLPPDERPVMRWNANPFIVDGGNGGRSESDGGAFLLGYWLGRHHGFLLGE
ncbi:MAG: hypothetical protein RLZZ15_416 [Verrucomicrobiota bacterium]|jgi:hypothetical protein